MARMVSLLIDVTVAVDFDSRDAASRCHTVCNSSRLVCKYQILGMRLTEASPLVIGYHPTLTLHEPMGIVAVPTSGGANQITPTIPFLQ